MAASQASGPLQGLVDPFVSENATSSATTTRRSSQRYSAFNSELFSQSQPAASPGQAKRALEAHLTETDRRLEEASKLGTALVQQRKDLAERLQEVESQQAQQEIGPELKQKLLEVEREFNELGRDSARAFLAPKTQSQNGGPLSELRNPASPTKFSSQATDSPSKVTVPSRKQRNQPSNRVHDIEFATEISTSLLAQVRQMQGVLAERDESLRKLTQEKSQIEVDHQGLTQRLRNIGESEQHYKDENWNLETKTHELMAAQKESAEREQKLQQSLATATREKGSAQRELDEIKSAYGTLSEEHAAFRKTHEAGVAGMKKSATLADSDRGALQSRIDELTAQNQELANAVAARMKGENREVAEDVPSDPEDFSLDKSDLEHSPPPSPSKGGARNSMLESETLKSSLNHAHRMIQSLKTNVHREKSEKLELKRLLQETRDELELRRVESGAASKRAKTKAQPEQSKKGSKLGQLGAGRSSRTEVNLEDGGWEDHQDRGQSKQVVRTVAPDAQPKSDLSDTYQTADETEDAYETADEKNTESEAFETGQEDVARSSEDLTETESSATRQNTVRGPRQLASSDKRASYVSTASTTDNDDGHEAKTPTQTTFGSIKNRFRLSRGSRRSRVMGDSFDGTPGSSKDSPASFRGQKGQSLAAELGDFDNESMSGSLQGTPSRNTTVSRHSTPGRTVAAAAVEPPVPKIPMIDAEVMTDVVDDEPAATAEIFGPKLDFSAIQSLETVPAPAAPEEGTDGMKEAAAAGMIGSVFGWAMGKRTSTPGADEAARRELADISPNVQRPGDKDAARRNDQSSQTTLSAEQIDSMLAAKDGRQVVMGSAFPVPPGKPGSPTGEAVGGSKPVLIRDVMPAARGARRPGSSGSARPGPSEVPPLPSDHRETIAAARTNDGAMGPPAMPASAYRTAPKKPMQHMPTTPESTPYGPARAGASAAPQGTPTTPRARYSANRSTRSRRSSVSSFESELDARFNIRSDGTPVPQGSDGGTDPRMIHAITQTMMGDYLWKYTRRPGRGDMSTKRHRRFFWVHPYTRTLYWSDQDPATAGRAQLKAKSVAIGAVRVVADDNHMPPGLHRKSLMILTPGREVKLTAQTGHHHEIWFNALSYLLLRSDGEPMAAADGSGLTADEVAEFNPTLPNRQSAASRASLSTYNSRPDTTRNSRMSSRNQSPNRTPGTSYAATGPYGTVVRRTVPHPDPQQLDTGTANASQVGTATSRSTADGRASGSLGSRLSMYLRPHRATASSLTAEGKAPARTGEGGIYDASVVNDSAEDVRQVINHQNVEADRLENVRACCDGKHDVGSLNHRHSGLGRFSTSGHSHAHHH